MKTTISLFAAFFSMVAWAHCADSTETAVDTTKVRTSKVPPILVSAARIGLNPMQIARSMDVITAKDLERLPVLSISDALRYVPGVDLRQRGPFGVQADISIRGGGFDQTAVLLNGMRMNDIQTGHHSLNLPMLPEEIERIEVVRGGSSRLFGPSALDGAINIITKQSVVPFAKVQAKAGDFGLIDARGFFGTSTGEISHRLSVQAMKHNGYINSTDVMSYSAMYTAQTKIDATSLRLVGGASDRAFGANGFYSPSFPNQFERTKNLFVSAEAKSELSENTTLTTSGLFRVNYDEFLLRRENPAFYQNKHTTHQTTGMALLGHTWDAGTTTLGVEIGEDNILSKNLGIHSRLRSGGSIEHIWKPLNNFSVAAGGSVTALSDRAPGYGYGVDVLYNPSITSKVFATVNRSYRIPTYTDLYYKDPTTVGNANLRPESAVTFELGGEYRLPGIEFRGSVFRRNGTDMIDYLASTDTAIKVFTAANITTIEITGFEAGITFPGEVNRDESLTQFQALKLAVNYNDVQNATPERTRYILSQLKWQGIAELQLVFPWNISASVIGRVLQRASAPDVFTVFDTKLSYTYSKLTITAEATNLGDTMYIETGFIQMPRRWFMIGAGFTIL